ncbi:hypothetical protein [Promicromonospora soli]
MPRSSRWAGEKLGQVEGGPQPDQDRLAHPPAARHRREEVRLVHHQQVPVAVQHLRLERDRLLVRGRVAVQVEEAARLVRRRRREGRTAARDDLAQGELLAQAHLVVAEPVQQVVERVREPPHHVGVVGQHEPGRVQPVPHGQRRPVLDGTGPASGA